MQFIFITLLLCNLVLVAWQIFDRQDPQGESLVSSGVSADRSSSGTLVLLEELSAKQADDMGVQRKLVGLQSLTPAQGQSATSNKCVILGPFVSQQSAQRMVRDLSSLNVLSSIESMEFPAGVGHWVYLPPARSRKEALKTLAVLQQRNIDSYVVPKGEAKNAISLGMFTKESLADGQLKKVKGLGFDAKLKVVQRTYSERWVMLSHQEEDKITSAGWVNLLKNKKSIKKRKNFCLGVALP